MTSGPEDHARLDRLRAAAETLLGTLDDDALRDIADHVDWLGCEGGQRLIRQGDPGDCAYLVLQGRLRATHVDDSGAVRVLGEIAAGESVGEVALITGSPRTATVHAIRDSVVVRIGKDAFEGMVRRHPELALRLARIVMRRQERSIRGESLQTPVRSIAVLLAGDCVPGEDLVSRLRSSLASHGTVRVLDQAAAPGEATELEMRAWLDDQESRHSYTVYVADPAFPKWAHRCLRQADRVLVAVHRDDPDSPCAFEQDHLAKAPAHGTSADLVVIHPDGATPPRGTAAKVSGRPVSGVHHVRLDRDDDFQRLARFLAGHAIGLVLAGGGAKGLAHVGVIRALRERGITVDAVGGTSIGAVTAAAIALDWDQDVLEQVHRASFADRNPMNDYAVPPMVSLFRGRTIDRALRHHLGGGDIEDAWIPFLAVSSNLTAAKASVHRRGTLWRAVRASLAIPGVLPPVVYGNDLHIDGGTFDNLPVEPMRELGAGKIIAVELSAQRAFELEYDEVPSSLELIVDRYVTRRRRLKVPGLTGTVLRATVLASLEKSARGRPGIDLALEPPVEKIGMLSWQRFDHAVEIGYRHTMERLDAEPGIAQELRAAPTPRT